MQAFTLVFFFLSLALTESFLFSSNKCPIEKYKSSKYLTGLQLLVHKDFAGRVKSVETVAKNCKVHVYIKGSYYQIPDPAQAVLIVEADMIVGHGFQFELRDENNGFLCNKLCLSRTPGDIPEAKCFLQGIASNGLTWSRNNPDVISDNTYASNTQGYQALKVDIQTKCQKQNFKRELLRALRRMYDEQEDQDFTGNSEDEEKKRK